MGDYIIPKGAVIIPNFWGLHRDPKLWKNPDIFDPSRFLKEEGSCLIAKPEYFVPFSIGKWRLLAFLPRHLRLAFKERLTNTNRARAIPLTYLKSFQSGANSI